VDDQLLALLSLPSQFSIASYLNLALLTGEHTSTTPTTTASYYSYSSSSNTIDDDELLQLQLQTQSCHEDGAKLQAMFFPHQSEIENPSVSSVTVPRNQTKIISRATITL
jgi:hypothetical protein